MAYQFETKPTGSFQYAAANNTKALTISQINARSDNAGTIVKGMEGLFWIADQNSEWTADDGTRTVKQVVVNDGT